MKTEKYQFYKRLLKIVLDNPTWCHGISEDYDIPFGLCAAVRDVKRPKGVSTFDAHHWMYEDIEPLRTRRGAFWFNSREERIAALKVVIKKYSPW